jgi:hypothetical protein
MPTGLLLPAFALVLLANAILIAIAIRSMRRGGALDDAPFPTRSTPPIVPSARRAPPSEHAPAPASAVAPVPPPAETPNAPDASMAQAVATARVADPSETSAAQTAVPPDPSPRGKPQATKARPRKPPATTTSRSGGRRRRFSLPPLDEDHEKVSRSIATFLDPSIADDSETTTDAVSGSGDDDTAQPPTTIALVAVSGPDDGDEPTSPVGLAVAALERALRGAARGTDRVDVLGAGKYRIVLASTGELAARAYLRRVRAITEPLLEELDPPRRLIVATATALGEPIGRAADIAERRLGALLDAARSADDVKPRAVPD